MTRRPLPKMTAYERQHLLEDLARGFGVPVAMLTMPDAEFHHWLHTTPEGAALLEAE